MNAKTKCEKSKNKKEQQRPVNANHHGATKIIHVKCVFKARKSKAHSHSHTHALTRLPPHKNISAGVSLPTNLSTTLQAETAVFCLYLLDNIRNGSSFFVCEVCVLCITACVFLSQYVHCICFERTNNPFSLTIFTREAFVSLYHNFFTTCFFWTSC